jgi:hypothetical protein
MTPEQLPSHALFIKWGKFKAGAFGIPAIVTLGLIVFLAWRMM